MKCLSENTTINMDKETLIRFLQNLSSQPNPTLDRRNALFSPAQTFLPAAVLLGIVPFRREWCILLTKRTNTLRHHTGQIAFPGGRRDPQDATFTATALREANEEIGTPPSVWQTFDPIAPCRTPSGYAVHTIPALAETEPALTPNPQEVAETFYIPLAVVLDRANYVRRAFTHGNRTLHTPALPYRHYDIWGLTAGILYTLAENAARQNL